MSAVRQATSRNAREVAHPRLIRSTVGEKVELCAEVDVAHPPTSRAFRESLPCLHFCAARGCGILAKISAHIPIRQITMFNLKAGL
jgi:hypothetical protein